MFKLFFLFISLFIFSGCIGDLKSVKPNEKVFDNEDKYIMFALRAEELKEYKTSAKLFNTLYEKSNKKEYLYRSLQSDLVLKEDEKIISKVDNILDGNFDDYKLVRFKIVALIQLKRLELAKIEALKLISLSNQVDDYLLLSEIYVKQNKSDTAIKYLESAYAKEYNEKILDKLSVILYLNLDRKKDAIAHLETHIMVHGCSDIICNRLIGFYSNENDIDGLLSIYLKVYKINKSDKIARKIVQIYNYKKEPIKLMNFLEESKSDDEVLLQIYISLNNYKKAFPLAKILYKKSGKIGYLGQSAVFKYESFLNKNDEDMLLGVIATLENVVKQSDEPLYLNYLGYLLIEHNLDIQKGINYVDEALVKNPTSVYYLDSKAWGYYKLGKCKKAFNIMKDILKKYDIDEPEVLFHTKKIKECIKLN